MKKYNPLFLLLLAPALSFAQKSVQTDNGMESALDSFVHNTVQPYIIQSSKVGISIGIFHLDKTFEYNYGTTQKDKQVLPSSRTIYEIGSISKTMTGTLLAQAVNDHKVKMNDDIRMYLDGAYPNLEFKGNPIRLFHLVSHISGLPFFIPDQPNLFKNPNYDSLPFVISRLQKDITKEKFLAELHQVKLDTIPGFNFHYSNAGAQLLKFILEKVYNKPFDKILETNISRPLLMINTNSLFSKNNTKLLAKGYNEKGNLMPYNPPILDAAGGIYSTVADMIKYLKFHLDENDAVVALSHQVTTGNLKEYAIGLNWQEQMNARKQKKIWQSGGSFGFSSYCVIYPELKIAIVMLTNESDQHSQGQMEEMADKIFLKINR